MPKKILLLSPYDALSHCYWRENLVREFPEYQFTVVTLPARFFSWRFRGNSLTLSQDDALSGDYDLLIATSMTDLAALKGMASSISQVPTLLYFHENQFAYPESEKMEHLIERQITSIYSAIAATSILFNSEYNRQTFLAGSSNLLKSMPDGVPEGIGSSLEKKSHVLSVPLGEECFRLSEMDKPERLGILWNHRWEWDKGLEELQQIIRRLLQTDLDFEFHLVGQQFRNTNVVMQASAALLRDAGRLGMYGFIESRDDYLKLIARCHCVLSTTRHEFQGLAVQEAMAVGCIPVVPDALVYPEYVPDACRYRSIDQAVALISKVPLMDKKKISGSMKLVSWNNQRASWQKIIQRHLKMIKPKA